MKFIYKFDKFRIIKSKVIIFYTKKLMKQLNQTSENLTVSPPKAIHDIAIEELQIKTKKGDKEDQNELRMLLTQILTYPTIQYAELHMQSDRLGTRDLRNQVNQRVSSSKQGSEQREHLEFCPCCGFAKQETQLKVCTNLGDINSIGISTYLYFQTIKNLIILLLLMTVIYSGYAFITNLIASGVYNKLIESQSLSQVYNVSIGYVSISLGSKQMNPTTQNKTYYLIQCWIGIGLVLAWLVILFILKNFQREKQERVEQDTISASDFSIMLENAPIDLTKQQLQESFNKYQQGINNVPAHLNKPLTIAKINKGKPFYLNEQDFKDEQLDTLRQKHKQFVETFVEWAKERQESITFSTTKQKREQKYNQYKQLIQKQVKKYEQIGNKIKQKIKQETKAETTTFFVTFQAISAMKLITRLNDPSLSAKIRYYLTCCQGHNKFHFMRGQQKFNVKIERAPEPEDIIWTNLNVPMGQAIKRKVITFTITFILLGISFAIVYGLSSAQKSAGGNSVLSLAISVFISVVNIILSIVIEKLSIFEMDFTVTKYQTSLALKSIFASLINSILIPIIVCAYIKEDIYTDKGLASDVFMLGLTNSFLPPILKFINIPYIVNRIIKYFASKPTSRLGSNQKQLNNKFQYIHFQVGLQYVYLISLYLFTCFFVSLQPIIALFAFCGMGLMYWAQKYTLFNKMNRPVPGTDLVNVTMFQLILFGGLTYSLGSLTWSNFMPVGIPKEALLPNLIALGVSIFMFLLPYRAIIALCSSEQGSIDHKFEQKRILLPSQYDRLNPATSAEAFIQFKNFYENYLKKFEKSSDTDKLKLMELFAKQNARGHQRPPPQMMNGGGNPFNAMFNTGPFMPPPPQQMMFMPPPQMFQQPGFGFRPMVPGYQQPGFQNNAFRPVAPGPAFIPAHLQPPGYRPVVQQPGFQQPGFQQPGFQQPGFQQPPPYRPVVQQSGFQQPGFQQPGFQQPGFQQPGFQQPGFQQPGFRPPQAQNFGFQPLPQNSDPFGFR